MENTNQQPQTATESVGVTETQTTKRIAPIQTHMSQGNEGWVNCKHDSWHDLTKDGWVFEYLSQDGWVAMSRNGYFNAFRNNPKLKDEATK